jgi:predicted glycoside hydrolase/deacetylase ChbG (UPF0249 family)
MLDKKIVVSADDFGENPTTNASILYLLKLKKLNRVSVMVGGKFSPEEIRSLLDSHVKLDLHLDFFNSLESDQHWRKKTGAFVRLSVFCGDYLSGKIKISRIEANLTQQLEKFRVIFGKNPAGLSSHEHAYFFPPYFKLILALAKKSHIDYLRFGKENFVKATSIVSLIIFFLRKINRRHFLASGLTSTDFLVSLDWLKNNTLREIKNLPSGEIELVIHSERVAEMEIIKNLDLSGC